MSENTPPSPATLAARAAIARSALESIREIDARSGCFMPGQKDEYAMEVITKAIEAALQAELKGVWENRDRELVTFNRQLAAAIRERDEARAENTRIRAALANSKDPCIYCQLPSEDMGKCRSGFPGCGRMDDKMGCPEFGASMLADDLQQQLAAANAALQAERVKAVEAQHKHAELLEKIAELENDVDGERAHHRLKTQWHEETKQQLHAANQRAEQLATALELAATKYGVLNESDIDLINQTLKQHRASRGAGSNKAGDATGLMTDTGT